MTHRRPATLLLATLLLAAGGCSGGSSGGAGGPGGGAPQVSLREVARPQAIDSSTVLLPCAAPAPSDEPDGSDAVAGRVATLVLPAAYGVDPFAQDLPPATIDSGDGADVGDDLPTCTFAALRGIDDLRVLGRDVFSLTLPVRGTLRDALPRIARGSAPQRVDDDVAVLGGRGERATYSLRVRGAETYDAVALQAGGLRLTWLAPRGRTPAQQDAARRLWQRVQASLAVRSPAASDGDADADSDGAGPARPTADPVAFAPVVADTPPGWRRVGCTRGDATLSFAVPARLDDGRGCSPARRQRWHADLERVTVQRAVGPLRTAYEQELPFEADGGDDAASDLEYSSDVAGPGGLRAESFVRTIFNDGSPEEIHTVQGGGVRVTWTVQPGAWGPQADELAVLLDSVGVRLG